MNLKYQIVPILGQTFKIIWKNKKQETLTRNPPIHVTTMELIRNFYEII